MDYKAMIPPDMRYFLDGFRKDKYPARFNDYLRTAEPEFMAIPQESDKTAEALLQWMDCQVTGLFRKRKRVDQQFFLMQYTIPAAIRCGRRDFAETLNAQWNAAYPDYKFGIATFEEFNKNFNNMLLGFILNKGDRGE